MTAAIAISRHYVALACAALLPALVFAVGAISRETWFIDDALIYQNFVRNALAGNGLVYFPGLPVEGYSSPLWVLALIAAGLLGMRGFMAAKLLGALCGMALCALTAMAPARQRLLKVLGGLVVAAQPALQWWSVSGMETALMTLLVGATAIAVFQQRHIMAAMAAGLAAIARPEGALYLLPVLAWLAIEYRHDARRRLILAALLACVPALTWQAYRYASYGTLVANSAMAKASLANLWDVGLPYVLGTLKDYPGPWMIFLGTLPFALHYTSPLAPVRRASFTVLAMIVLATLFAAAFGDWMPRGRLLIPVLPLLVLWPLQTSTSLPKTWRRMLLINLLMASVVTGLLQVIDYRPALRNGQVFFAEWPQERRPFVDDVAANATQSLQVKYLLRYSRPGDRVLIGDVGQSGYFASDVQILDQYGLVSRYEAEYLRGQHTDAEYLAHFEALSPTVALIASAQGAPIQLIGQTVLPVLLRDYTLVMQTGWWADTLLSVYVRNDAVNRQADPARLAHWQAASPGLRFSAKFLLAD